MIDWTKDERIAELVEQAVRHFNEFDELSLEHEAQMELIREEYMWERSNDYRGGEFGEFDDWHGQLTVEEFVTSVLP
jgi:hypothetical protein